MVRSGGPHRLVPQIQLGSGNTVSIGGLDVEVPLVILERYIALGGWCYMICSRPVLVLYEIVV